MFERADFELFGEVHVATVAFLCLLGFVLIYPARKYASHIQARRLAAGIGVYMLVQEVVDRVGRHVLNGEPWHEVLPLHMCGASLVLVALLLIKPNQVLYQLTYFWGLGGATVALVVPDIELAFPHLLNITYFVSHGLIIIGVLYVTIVFNYRPTLRGLMGVFLFSYAYLLVIGGVNYLLKTNYLFIAEKPEIMYTIGFPGEWPWYIVNMILAGTAVFFALYTPYFVRDALAERKGPCPGVVK